MFTTETMEDSLIHQGKRKKLAQELSLKSINNEKVLAAILKIPRHWFFPKDFEPLAYRDAAFPIEHGQTISQPYTVAWQTQLIDIQENDKVLEVGTGSGYQAAILGAMGVELYSIEYIKPLLETAAKILSKFSFNIKLFHGDGSLGLPKHAPYKAIIVTAGAPTVPDSLKIQLSIGGRLVIPVGQDNENLKMLKITRTGMDTYNQEIVGDCKFVPLKGKQGWGE